MSIPTPTIPDTDARQNLRWLFVLRNLMICGEGLLVWISRYGLDIPLREVPLWGVLTLLSLFNWWTWLRLSSPKSITENEIFVQLSCDVLGIAGMLYFTGGATNPLAWFFLLPLMIAATVLPQEYTWYTVIFTSGCYTLLMAFYQPLPDIHPLILQNADTHGLYHSLKNEDLELHVFGMWFGFVFSAALVAYFVVEMANTLRERDRRLAEIREQNLRGERILALGALAAGAAHEMGTPLGTIAILISEIESEYLHTKNDEFLEKVRTIRDQVSRCKQALSVLSATAGELRAESGHTMPLTRYLEETIAIWRNQRPRTALVFTLNNHHSESPTILAERTLTHALCNLLNNASDVSPEGIELAVRWDTEYAYINIMDRGPGIAPMVSEQIGKIPVSTKEYGLGVGLFLAFFTIERLGGEIKMTSRIGGGTNIYLVLPLVCVSTTF